MIENSKDIFFIGQNICRLRKDLGITQVELANVLGINKRTLCSYEKGFRKVPINLLSQIAESLKISTDKLLGLEGLELDGRSADAKLMKRFQKISSLSEEKRKTIVQILDTLLADASKS